jgi:hypothetical protein
LTRNKCAAETATSSFGRAFFTLAEGFGIVGDGPLPAQPNQGYARIRAEGEVGPMPGC